MPVPFESQIALEVMRALGNTLLAGTPLETPGQLDALLEPWPPYSGLRTRDAEETRQVAELRADLVALWDAGRDEAAARANAILADYGEPPQLVRHDDQDWHLHAVDPGQPLATRIAVESAMAYVDLVRADETDRCKRCADDTCRHLFLDASRNRSRRFCCTQCQARINVAAYRARQD